MTREIENEPQEKANIELDSGRCRCRSYNRPDWGGDLPEVILPTPKWSDAPNGICVDSCIVDAIKLLWDHGIVTEGCCCGHNKSSPSVIIAANENPKTVIELLSMYDSRKWKVMQWTLVTHEKEN